ncbi:MAG: hypothetical protein M0R17_05125 [Candidatus Omnitrophica bacterium]|jgi:hypothetical protein|nr:hypothetical protein [Candidatus Omnitrophota bacterium]
MFKVKGVEMIDGLGNISLVTGLLTDDHKYVVASQLRSWIGDLSTNKNGNDVRIIGFGETIIFRADNVQIDGDFATADLSHIMGPLTIQSREIKQPNKNKFISINSFLNEKNGTKQFKNITNKGICNAVIESLNIAGEELDSKPAYDSTNSKVAGAIGALARAADASDKRKRTTVVADVSESKVSGMTAEQVFDN